MYNLVKKSWKIYLNLKFVNFFQKPKIEFEQIKIKNYAPKLILRYKIKYILIIRFTNASKHLIF